MEADAVVINMRKLQTNHIIFIVFILLISLYCRYSSANKLSLYSKQEIKMGTLVEVQLLASSQRVANKAISAAFSEVDRLENILSSYRNNSEVAKLNHNAGIKSVKVGNDLWIVIKKAIQINHLSKGAFDITFKPLWDLWKTNTQSPPSLNQINCALKLVGTEKIKLDSDNHSVFLPIKGMKIDLGGIAKGYVVDKALHVLEKLGIKNALVNAGGDLRAIGKHFDRFWTAGIRHPRKKGVNIASLPIHNEAIVTSGDYERYLIIQGKRYPHIIDPRTGYPVQNMISVTVIGPTAMEADAISTSIFVIGDREGLKLANKLSSIEAIIIDKKGDFYKSNGISLNN